MPAPPCPKCNLHDVRDGFPVWPTFWVCGDCGFKWSQLPPPPPPNEQEEDAARDEGMARVYEHGSEIFIIMAIAVIRMVCRLAKDGKAGFIFRGFLCMTTDDMRPYLHYCWPREPKILGPIMSKAKHQGLIGKTGDGPEYVKSKYKHGGPSRVWRIL